MRNAKRPRLASVVHVIAAVVTFAIACALWTPAHADEGGVSFWAPGQFGSLAAVPGEPGLAVPLIYLHESVDAHASKNFIIGGNLAAGLDANADLAFLFPTYTFAQPVLGGQAALGLGFALGHMRVRADVAVTGPLGSTLTETRTDRVTGGSDLYGLGTLKWNRGPDNYMAYTMIGAPVGAYRLGRLANLGTNHWSIDAGGGYT